MLYWALIGLSIAMCSCSGSQKKTTQNTEVSNVEIPSEDAMVLDSISNTVNQIKTDIDRTSKELDELLDEL